MKFQPGVFLLPLLITRVCWSGPQIGPARSCLPLWVMGRWSNQWLILFPTEKYALCLWLHFSKKSCWFLLQRNWNSLKPDSIEHMEQTTNPSSTFRLGGLRVVDFPQREQFHTENFQLSELSGGTDKCEDGMLPSVASGWANMAHPRLGVNGNASFHLVKYRKGSVRPTDELESF